MTACLISTNIGIMKNVMVCLLREMINWNNPKIKNLQSKIEMKEHYA